MYLYWLLFFIVLAGDYGRTENIYLGNQCYHFMGKIFICKKDANTEALSPLLVHSVNVQILSKIFSLFLITYCII